MKMTTKTLLAAGAAIALSSAARADTFDAETFSVYGQATQLLTPDPIDALAGRITFSGPSGSINVWCMDVGDILFVPYNYEIGTFALASLPKPGVPSGITQAQLDAVADLVVLGNKAIDVDGASATVSAEYQVAIWSVEYGNAFTYSASAGFRSDVDALVALAEGGDYANGHNLRWLSDAVTAPNQTMVWDGPVPTQTGSAPEASTWAMAGLGFAFMATLGAFRRKPARSIETSVA